mmetsp:Transcript_10636/g.21060  ORF Transcript_10636/g.21060 Transcript_10636/m.21060 type:complete len:339 (-) Transcript_10636:84-1100(-)|eukprot:CAMPEP_0173387018 /NCGR_PEP_ID=MMETSP1356-20130122/9567_1 /TAXON_ID=77927 ORGANISM="Hemiselmis virescens, Strain PCC157" /NCGR_SAMPLE_ID=MMETSP1356 /ASSEMBLY_ACC=CAM_ASM_000847 /LENGTH=338 /DNA_ID=CAMNT_0014343469 /DNA_START=275 /DNA_END=1291 /DNA_ORIENTATION=+
MAGAHFGTDGDHAAAPVHSTAEGAHTQSYQTFVQMLKDDAEKTQALIPAVISLLEERIEHNDSLVLAPGSKYVMNITIRDYMKRIEKYSNASPCCYTVGLIFLERLKKSDKRKGREAEPLLTSATYQRLVITAIMVAAKFLDDYYHSNKHWALIAGLPTAELNKLEVEFLEELGYKLHIQREEYDWFAQELYERVERETTEKRFSEMNVVTDETLSRMSTPPTSSASFVSFASTADGHDHSHSKPYAIPARQAAAAPYFNIPAERKTATPPPQKSARPLQQPTQQAPQGRVVYQAKVHYQQGGMPVQGGHHPVQMQVQQPPVHIAGGFGMPQMVQWGR